MKTPIVPSSQIFDHPWTPEQLLAVCEASRVAQSHSDYAPAARVISRLAGAVDLPGIRRMVAAVMGGTAGTHYICGALQGAHLAISLPNLFTDRQLQLLLGPLSVAQGQHQTDRMLIAA
ncbi:hypothetical protein I6N91_10965 [Arthrobacter sp. MSA 4-2]|uniref:hypothetical protein n=1 Tax=Arthrobacter sp. MSA 4-2 TaxID=2794349 RepID=UPI0018E6FC3A|nr:hypothetical protein [Arthrobacter sp. MSA 4-2]MBJ2121498.1 hypothetical protein [Arthrobacter sp. MSA 4-2]